MHVGAGEDRKEQLLDNFYLYDGKEFFVQKVNQDQFISQVDIKQTDGTYTILVREFKAETWEFGTLYEVRIDKMITGSKLGDFLQANLFPHIPSETLVATKVDITKPFIRSDLVL